MTFRDRSGFGLRQRIEIQQTIWLTLPLLSSFFSALPMALDEIHRYKITHGENRIAAVYGPSTITSLSSGSSCSNYASNHSIRSSDSRDKIPPQDIIDTLNLLDQVEREVSHEIARVQDKIKEAREMVETYRRERRARMKENAALVAEEERQTRRADDELWLAV